MKEKLKIYLKIKTILIGICFVAFSCIKDDFTVPIQDQNLRKLDFTGYILPTDSVFNSNPILKNHVLGKFPTKSNEFSRTLESETLGFSIDTTQVMILRSDNFDSYTFTVEREDFDDTVLENYVLTYYSDNRYTQFLMSYPIIENNDGTISFDVTNATATSINDSGLLFRGLECASYAQEWQSGDCFDVNCDATGSGNGMHGPGDNCTADPEDQPYSWCAPGTWVNTFCTHYISEDDGGGGNTTGGGGNTTTNNNDQEEEEEEAVEFPTVPFDDELGLRSECKKINKFLNDPNNAIFKQKLLALANPANYAQNLDVEIEKSITAHENETNVQEREGIDEDDASVDISYTATHPNNTTGFVHTHPNDTEGTYSVFSFDDLKAIWQILHAGKLETGTFVAFLITKKGDSLTYYAMTINNKTKFKDFFLSYQEHKFSTLSQEDKDKIASSAVKAGKLDYKYYSSKVNPKIGQNNGNREQMLTEFLNFIKEGDLGVSMFETDENFSDFSRVKASNGSLEREPCNN